MDVDDLRHRFDEYRELHPELPSPGSFAFPLAPAAIVPPPSAIVSRPRSIEDIEIADEDEDEPDEETILFRPGMTLREIEHAAILATLRQVRGNRRKAAEALGMGERTLYRKIKEYGIPL
jgi:DNA-binding NtrC family response regulator